MANTSVVYARIDSDLKSNAESILSRLGITPTSAVQMLYSQIVLNNGLPFALRIPTRRPLMLDELSHEELDAQLARGIDSIKRGDVLSEEEVDAMLTEELGA